MSPVPSRGANNKHLPEDTALPKHDGHILRAAAHLSPACGGHMRPEKDIPILGSFFLHKIGFFLFARSPDPAFHGIELMAR